MSDPIPTVEEVREKERDARLTAARNEVGHLDAILEAMNEPAITDLMTLCNERAGQIGSAEIARIVAGLGNVMNSTRATMTRRRDESAALLAS